MKKRIKIDGLKIKGLKLEVDTIIGKLNSFEVEVNEIFQEELNTLQDVVDEKINIEELDMIEFFNEAFNKFLILQSQDRVKSKLKDLSILYRPGELLTIDIYSPEHIDKMRLEKIRLILPYMEDKEISYYVDLVCPKLLRKGELEIEELDLSDNTLKEMNTNAWGNIAYISIHGKGELKKLAKEKLDRAKYLCKST